MSKWPVASVLFLLAMMGWSFAVPASRNNGPCYIHKEASAGDSGGVEWLVIPGLVLVGFAERRWFWLAPTVLTAAVTTSFLTCRELDWTSFWLNEFWFTIILGFLLVSLSAFGCGARTSFDSWRARRKHG